MGKDKGLSLLNGKPLIEYACETLKNICDSIIISSNSSNYGYLGCKVVKDEVQEKGPAGGIYSCLKASETNENFIISCDTPMITAELIRYILSFKGDFDAVIPVFNGYPEPLCAFYRKSSLTAFEESLKSGKYKIQEIIKELKSEFVEIESSLPFYSSYLFTNVNTPEGIMNLEKQISANPD